jgi:hypothetical protein
VNALVYFVTFPASRFWAFVDAYRQRSIRDDATGGEDGTPVGWSP